MERTRLPMSATKVLLYVVMAGVVLAAACSRAPATGDSSLAAGAAASPGLARLVQEDDALSAAQATPIQPADQGSSGSGDSQDDAAASAFGRQAAPLRIPRPAVPEGPRRIGLQAGHWLPAQIPEELRRLEHQTGTSWGSVTEWELNLAIAHRVAAILRGHGYAVDILPTAIPPGYLADVFVALHADGDASGARRGFKAAHGSRRGPYESQLVQALVEEYGRATGLPVDPQISRNMLGYYAFSWSRYTSTVAPHTPAAILEMGFLTSAADRVVLLQRPDLVASGIANGVLRFLEEVPAGAAFADDLVVAPRPIRPPVAAPA